MIHNEEEQLEKKIEKNQDPKINHKKYDSDNLIKKNLIQFLEIQLKESEEKIIEKEEIVEKEIVLIHNRFNKEIEKSIKFSLEKIIIDFLPIIDNIERALNLIETINLKQEKYTEILKKLQFICNLLEKFFYLFNIKKINDTNVLFNPSIHQAMSIHYTNDIISNQIVTVMQSGYILHKSRLLRPAMVVVSKEKI
ncbi:nucleotide exchange factor GrpE [Buchnera aphidicola str. APS (Acyrthosiphon pisum)]|uniref:Protein GrpE 1 n=1 Tax=Buchnera aphidicola subsp. Acyrthosiphon pisum (strain APS) TaxID=107806 RepID=GRPE1_BUCAI|nr:nucleotide exchange factor GrpE [Buchnera aphidicola]P57340.1 RecName: Full=Protein GrpE 1; AltName: Full=HSP-70 cofactor 1 [Buchnera aphidicola str. APS (Acyrthosiphon pisum)]pir/B84959/ heat shock protein grpE 1 [imported] - Buchnera sp. (strain APS) [Buchnera sp. (in: enterobacteria)]BAB12962.1 heat shock protein grpE 1 [Buchnera aphidicola str. APS (Acyrthosiphon pisum)]